jgi:pimeloyl-ACP methyl ester carboxylesterase
MEAALETFFVATPRIRMHCWAQGPTGGVPVLAVHGNLSTGRFYRALAEELPDGYRMVAPDLRGFGRTERKVVDATRGLRDWSDDLRGLLEALGWTGGRRVHAVGWSLGGGVLQQYLIDHPDDVASATLMAPLSPYGFSGTKDGSGIPCFDDFAGSGGGTAAPDFVRRLREGDRSEEEPASSPRVVMRSYFWSPTFKAPDEAELTEELLLTWVDDGGYPGSVMASTHWPGVGPGMTGINNAMSPKFCNTSAIIEVVPKAPILWIRGDQDQVVADASLFDIGNLGRIGALPGWPGEAVYPPQPMIAQTRAVFER